MSSRGTELTAPFKLALASHPNCLPFHELPTELSEAAQQIGLARDEIPFFVRRVGAAGLTA